MVNENDFKKRKVYHLPFLGPVDVKTSSSGDDEEFNRLANQLREAIRAHLAQHPEDSQKIQWELYKAIWKNRLTHWSHVTLITMRRLFRAMFRPGRRPHN